VFSGDRATLTARLDNTKDKLIKALNANGPNAGSENYQSVISQLDNFDAALQATQLTAQYAIYKNELEVRSEVFRFNLLFRALPSLPPGGFAP
jgi:lipase chaperone LimK